MSVQVPAGFLHEIDLDRDDSLSLQRQLYDQLRDLIAAGRLAAGTRLPSTRRIANELGIARNTILAAFEELAAGGYVEARRGAGTYVAATFERVSPGRREVAAAPIRLSAVARRALRGPVAADGAARSLVLQPGTPALDAFPVKTWRNVVSAVLRDLGRGGRETLGYGWPGGYPPLRSAIAEHARVSRGVRCAAEQVVITAGAQGAVDLVSRVLLDPGDVVAFEDPGYRSARDVFHAAGQTVVPVPVGREGFTFEGDSSRAKRARLAYVTPSHQYPTGVTMTLPRRLALLEWAYEHGAWIVEDDYDSEFRHTGKPLTALQGQDESGSVLYAGTFSKTLFPALRVGYLILPRRLIQPFVAVGSVMNRNPPVLEQMVLARFLNEGHYTRHLARMRPLYASRRRALEGALAEHARDVLDIIPSQIGLQLAALLPPGVDDGRLARGLAARGLGARPLSYYAARPLRRGGLNLGFANASEDALREAVATLLTTLTTLAASASCDPDRPRPSRAR